MMNLDEHQNDSAVIRELRESLSGLAAPERPPLAAITGRGRAHQRRLAAFAGIGVTSAAAGIALALGLTGVLGAGPARNVSAIQTPAPAGRTGTLSTAAPAGQHSVKLAAFTVTNGPGDSTTLILRKGRQYRLDPAALRQALARHGIPALVTVGTFCRSRPTAPVSSDQVMHTSNLDGGSAIVINGRAMPSGVRLSIGYFPGYIRFALIGDGALSCGSTADQPAMRATPSGTPIRG